MTGKILVLGATGNVGTTLVKALVEKGESVKAATRSGKAVAGAEGVAFDYTGAATFGPAFEGVDRAYVMLPAGYVNARELLLPVIAAAAARKVKVVFQSVFGVDADDSIPYRQVEITLENSGTPYVILRPNWFADNFHTYWKAGIDHGAIAVPAGEGKSSFIDTRDIADSAVAALTSSAFDNKAFNLTGPEALGYAEAAKLLSETIGKPITYQPVDDATFVGILTGAGVPDDYANFLAAIFHPVREGWTAPLSDAVQTLTGHAPRSLATYAADIFPRGGSWSVLRKIIRGYIPEKMSKDICHCIVLRKASRKVSSYYDEALAPLGINIAQFSLLRHINRMAPVSLTDLGARVELDRSTVGRNAKVLERMGLVDIRPGKDQREATLTVSEAGHTVLREGAPLWDSVQDKIEARLGLDGADRLRELLEAL